MTDYAREYREFSLPVPERFSFPLDVFDPWGDRLALCWTDGTREIRLSFNELKGLSSKAAGALKRMGIKRKDKVLVMLPNIPEWWEVMLALMRLNAIPIPTTPVLSQKEIEYRLTVVDVKAVVVTDDEAPKVEAAINNISRKTFFSEPTLVVVGERKNWHSYRGERDRADMFTGERTSSKEPAILYFTSGTTGPPKMVLHTQASYPFAHKLTGRYWLDLRPGDTHWNLSDTGWAKAAWSSLFGPWQAGAAVFSFYRKGKFDPSLAVETLSKYPITTFCGPPTAYRMMVKETDGHGRFDFPSLRHFAAAGEPLNKEIIAVWQEKTGLPIYDGYGQTETVIVLGNFRCLPIKPGSMGVPVPGFVVDILDDNGNPVPPGIEGDIVIRMTPERPIGLFKEYLWNPAATERAFRGQWYVTGDRAYKDEEDYFWFVGRADDIILASGYRIGPFEIESVLIEHPAVKESAVVASPDALRGEVIKAFIVLTKACQPSDALAKEIQVFVKERTAPYKYPRKVEFVEELPKTASGKIKRRELKAKEFGRSA